MHVVCIARSGSLAVLLSWPRYHQTGRPQRELSILRGEKKKAALWSVMEVLCCSGRLSGYSFRAHRELKGAGKEGEGTDKNESGGKERERALFFVIKVCLGTPR